MHFCDFLAATYDSLGASHKALHWVGEAMKLTECKRPHEYFLRGTVYLNYRRPEADAARREQDFADAERDFTRALELQSEVDRADRFDDLVLAKTYLFRGKARFLRAKLATGDQRQRLVEGAREDCDQAKNTLLALKEANPEMVEEAERWLREAETCVAETNEEGA